MRKLILELLGSITSLVQSNSDSIKFNVGTGSWLIQKPTLITLSFTCIGKLGELYRFFVVITNIHEIWRHHINSIDLYTRHYWSLLLFIFKIALKACVLNWVLHLALSCCFHSHWLPTVDSAFLNPMKEPPLMVCCSHILTAGQASNQGGSSVWQTWADEDRQLDHYLSGWIETMVQISEATYCFTEQCNRE